MLVAGRRRDPAAGRHPLRAGGRRHRDHDRAPGRVQPRDPPPGGRGPQRVADLRRPRGAGPPRARRAVRLADQPGPAGRDRRGRPGLRRHRDAGDDRRRRPVGRTPPLRRRRVPDAVRSGPLHGHRPAAVELPEGAFSVATRRGKQFNSMVFAAADPLNGAARDAVLIDEDDAAAPRPRRRRPAPAASSTRHLRRPARLVRLPRRTLQVHWPEGNVLLPSGPSTASPAPRCPTTTPWSGSSRCRPDLAVPASAVRAGDERRPGNARAN